MAVSELWVAPDEVIEYTSYEDVKKRPRAKLIADIIRARQKVVAITNNHFQDYEAIPEPVRMAVILLAEAYAKNDIEISNGGFKSETFDDYSYTRDSATIDLSDLGLDDLLSDYIVTEGIGRVVMKLRAI
ncbi:MAG: DUF3199 family protein [Clostridiales bacterium]|nr:DUF3199 family protein [Clostridiales bacterium]